jgi:hypothetical protein
VPPGGVFLGRAPLAQLLALPVDADADVGVDFTNAEVGR